MRRIALLALTAAVFLIPAGTADAKGCKSKDLRYSFAPGLPLNFGPFNLREHGTTCSRARSVARRLKRSLQLDKQPKHVLGYKITYTVPAAQTFGVKARKGHALITFRDVVANG